MDGGKRPVQAPDSELAAVVAPVRTLQDEFRERFRTLTTRLRESTEARLIEKSSEGLYGLTRRELARHTGSEK